MTAPENTQPEEGQGPDVPAGAEGAAAEKPKSADVVMEEATEDEKTATVSSAPTDDTPAPEAPEAAGVGEATAEAASAEAPDTGDEAGSAEEPAVEATAGASEAPATAEGEQAEMAAAVEADERLEAKLKPGQRVDVKLVTVGEKESFVDFGGTSEGAIATSELKATGEDAAEGELRVKEGDSFPVFVKEAGDRVVFTTALKGGKGDSLQYLELEQAFENKVPVKGKVRKTNKGGFEVELSGIRAFCPFSQIELGYCENPEEHVGHEYDFRVVTFERGGRNIVVSRRKLLEASSKERAVETRKELELGQVREGVVRRLQPYGAFVDIGGLDGLVHVSEISRAHIRNPSDVLKVGQKVNVQVTKVENLGSKGERVSLSIKALEPDPWEEFVGKVQVGDAIQGKVVRLAEFGAFVQVIPGIDGLLHISEISTGRLNHPGDVLKQGQDLDVVILSVDPDSKRISLGMAERIEAPGGGGAEATFAAGGRGRGPRREEKGPVHYRSQSTTQKKPPEITEDMDPDKALELLKKRLKGEL